MPFLAPRSSFTRPNDTNAYSIGDLVANSTTAGQVTRMRFPCDASYYRGKIIAVNFWNSVVNVTLATFSVLIFRTDPGVLAVGDNAAFTPAAGRDLLAIVPCDLSTGANVTAADKSKRFPIAGAAQAFDVGTGGALFGLITAGAAYVPAANEVFEITLELEGL